MKILRRVALVVGLLVFPAVLLFFGLKGFVVRNAVVNAEVVELRAPFAGQVAALAVQRGSYLDAAGGVVRLEDPRRDARALAETEAAIAAAEAGLAARASYLAEMEAELATLERRLETSRRSLAADIAVRREALLAEQEGLLARIDYLQKQYERARRLQGSAASQAAMEAADAELKQAQATLAALAHDIERLAGQAGYLDETLLTYDLADEALDLMSARRGLVARHQDASLAQTLQTAALAALRRRLDSEQAHLALVGETLLELPAGSIVWDLKVAAGSQVSAGQPLLTYLSCDARYLQAAVDDSTIELIRPGHAVEVTLYGTSEKLPGRVRAIYGSGGKLALRDSLAATLHDAGTSDATLLIEIPPAAPETREQQLCDIGRTAYVRFEGIGLLDPLINRLF